MSELMRFRPYGQDWTDVILEGDLESEALAMVAVNFHDRGLHVQIRVDNEWEDFEP